MSISTICAVGELLDPVEGVRRYVVGREGFVEVAADTRSRPSEPLYRRIVAPWSVMSKAMGLWFGIVNADSGVPYGSSFCTRTNRSMSSAPFASTKRCAFG